MSFPEFARRALPFTTVAVVIAAAYAGWVLWSRHSANRAIERSVQERRAEADRRIIERYGNELKILMFYPSPPAIRRGEKSLLCYGVANATTVRLEPHVADLDPALSRCIEVHPQSSTKYTLTAQDAKGETAQQTIEIRVVP